VRTAPWLLLAAVLVAPAAADDGIGVPRLLERFAAGEPLNLQLAFDVDATTHDLHINTTSAGAAVGAGDERAAVSFTTASFEREGVAHCFRVRVKDGALASLELLVLVPGPEGDRAKDEWRPVPPEVFLFVPADPPQTTSEVDEEGRVLLSAWGTCPLERGSKERGRALLVVRSGHVEGAGEARY
jgi:hypothetical protein